MLVIYTVYLIAAARISILCGHFYYTTQNHSQQLIKIVNERFRGSPDPSSSSAATIRSHVVLANLQKCTIYCRQRYIINSGGFIYVEIDNRIEVSKF